MRKCPVPCAICHAAVIDSLRRSVKVNEAPRDYYRAVDVCNTLNRDVKELSSLSSSDFLEL